MQMLIVFLSILVSSILVVVKKVVLNFFFQLSFFTMLHFVDIKNIIIISIPTLRVLLNLAIDLCHIVYTHLHLKGVNLAMTVAPQSVIARGPPLLHGD